MTADSKVASGQRQQPPILNHKNVPQDLQENDCPICFFFLHHIKNQNRTEQGCKKACKNFPFLCDHRINKRFTTINYVDITHTRR